MKLLQIEKPKRDQYGYYIHPQCPRWDESTTKKERDKWLSDNQYALGFDTLESSGSEACRDKYAGGSVDISSWEPVLSHHNAILISIHDSDDGPVALYLIPIVKNQCQGGNWH